MLHEYSYAAECNNNRTVIKAVHCSMSTVNQQV